MQRLPSTVLRTTGLASRFARRTAIWRSPLKKGSSPVVPSLLLFLLILAALAFNSTLKIDTSTISAGNPSNQSIVISDKNQLNLQPKKLEFPLNCSSENQTQTCPTNYPTSFSPQDPSMEPDCPDYFRWIHEDLRPWKDSGITRDMVERAKPTAHFRLVIIKGKAYVEKYRKSIQTRDMFTVWGILQLLRRYPGQIPDLELMFDCDDQPVIQSRHYRGKNATSPPPLFRYCGDRWTMDIVFPDWSFWGWAEINIKPWERLQMELKQGNERKKWIEREPHAYWKGNPFVAESRRDLLKCNVSETQDWNARLFIQDWILESQQGFKNSDLARQCAHRFKIYIEGYAWSVSEKYILACDSTTLLVKPQFYDFFTRSLNPLQHYWPIRTEDKCRSLKFAVDWGNSHKQKAREIGKASSDFIQERVKMSNVYDYMFQLMNEYAKLLRFEPEVPEGAVEVCSELMACPAGGTEKEFMVESLTMSPSATGPCTMPPPYEPKLVDAMWRKSASAIRRVERWENEFWQKSQNRSA